VKVAEPHLEASVGSDGAACLAVSGRDRPRRSPPRERVL